MDSPEAEGGAGGAVTKRRRGRRIVIVLALLLAFPTSCEVIFWQGEKSTKVTLGQDVPDQFPVAVLTPGETPGDLQVQVVYWQDLGRFMKEHPDYSFLVPEARQQRLSERLRQEGKFWDADIRAKEMGAGQQLVELHASEDDDRVNVGWYRTDGKHIDPMHHQFYFGPGMAMGAVFMTTLLWFVGIMVFLIARAIYRHFHRKPAT